MPSESKSFLLTCEAGRSLIYHMSLDNTSSGMLLPLSIRTNEPVAVTYHDKEERVYWAEESGAIFSDYLNGTSGKVVIDAGLSQPSSIAIDRVGLNLYFADQAGHRILVSKLDGAYPSTVISISSPTGIALDSDEGCVG